MGGNEWQTVNGSSSSQSDGEIPAEMIRKIVFIKGKPYQIFFSFLKMDRNQGQAIIKSKPENWSQSLLYYFLHCQTIFMILIAELQHTHKHHFFTMEKPILSNHFWINLWKMLKLRWLCVFIKYALVNKI